MNPEVGDVIAGKYRLERVLGAGAMGMVFAATHLELERSVAVKFVNSDLVQHPEIAARFLREARAAVKIQSEHVAQVIDVGHPEGGLPYIVMEYLQGQDLSQLIRRGAIDVTDAVDYVVQACSAMLEAHLLGIVHRDLKPANLFLTHRRDGSPIVKVLDFGISKWNEAQPAQAALTNTSALLGSPAYMSPEQLQSARGVDRRSDIWALGVILYELLTRRPAFGGETLPVLLTSILRDDPPRIELLNPNVDSDLASVVYRCLQKDREQRFQSVGELASALRPFAPERSLWDIERISRSSGLAPPLRPSAVPASEGAQGCARTVTAVAAKDGTAGTWVEDRAPRPRSVRTPAVLAGLLLGAAVLLGGLFAVGSWLRVSPPEATGGSAAQRSASRSSDPGAPARPAGSSLGEARAAPPGRSPDPSEPPGQVPGMLVSPVGSLPGASEPSVPGPKRTDSKRGAPAQGRPGQAGPSGSTDAPGPAGDAPQPSGKSAAGRDPQNPLQMELK